MNLNLKQLLKKLIAIIKRHSRNSYRIVEKKTISNLWPLNSVNSFNDYPPAA